MKRLVKVKRASEEMSFDDFLSRINEHDFTVWCEDFVESYIDSMEEWFYVDAHDTEANQNLYNNIRDLTLEEYLNDFVDTDSLGEQIVDAFDNNFEEEIDVDNSFGNDAYIWITENIVNDKEDMFERALKKFLMKNAKVPGFNTNGDDYIDDIPEEYQSISDEDVDNDEQDVSDLIDLDDDIGEMSIFKDDVDYQGERDKAFMYFGGKIIYSEPGETHSQLMNHWLVEQGKETITDDYDTQFAGSRPTKKQVETATDSEGVAYGSIAGDIAFIEVTEGCDPEDVVKALQKEGKYSKIYNYIRNGNGEYVARMAYKK